MEKCINLEPYTLIDNPKKENKAKRLLLIGLVAMSLSACSKFEIPEDCDESATTVRGVANTLLESGYPAEMVQQEIYKICQ